MLLPGQCSSCSWFSFSLIPAGLILGCYCAPTRSFCFKSSEVNPQSSALTTQHCFTTKHLQFLNNSLGLGVYIKILTHHISCGIWIMRWKAAPWPTDPGCFAFVKKKKLIKHLRGRGTRGHTQSVPQWGCEISFTQEDVRGRPPSLSALAQVDFNPILSRNKESMACLLAAHKKLPIISLHIHKVPELPAVLTLLVPLPCSSLHFAPSVKNDF